MVTDPLYGGQKRPNKELDSHAGLFFNKFYRYEKGVDAEKDETSKSNFLNLFRGTCGDRKLLEHYQKRQSSLIRSLNGQQGLFKNEWHFVTGMGLDHPLENGLSWHPTLGVPYLAGSAVKGLVRAWCEIWEAFDQKKLYRWFGTESSEKEQNAGCFIFFDAVPNRPVTLTPDVMTPHMGDWYEKGGVIEAKNYAKALPADWHDPVPVGFLAVKEISLLFGVAVRSGLPDREKEQAESELETVFGYLKNALEWLGAGAKTAAGYGRFVEDGDFAKKLAREKAALEEAKQKAEQERQRQIELSKLGPLDRKIKETIDNRLDLNMKPITALIKALESGVFEEKKAAAEKIKSIMEAENAWKPTTASKKPEKDKDHQATLVVLKYL